MHPVTNTVPYVARPLVFTNIKGARQVFTSAQVIAGVTDDDRDALSIIATPSTTVAGGTITSAGTGDGATYTYIPPSARYTGTDSAVFTVADSRGASVPVTVTFKSRGESGHSALSVWAACMR